MYNMHMDFISNRIENVNCLQSIDSKRNCKVTSVKRGSFKMFTAENIRTIQMVNDHIKFRQTQKKQIKKFKLTYTKI